MGLIATVRSRAIAELERVKWLAPLLGRLAVGLLFMSTGWGKVHEIAKVAGFFRTLGIPAPGFNARLTATTELVGGLLVLAGLGTRLAALPLAFTMVIAILTAKRATVDGVSALLGLEEWSYLVFFVWLALAGAGRLSLDALIARRRRAGRQPATS